MGWPAMTSRMGRRIAFVLAVCAAAPLVLFAIVGARDADSAGSDREDRRLGASSHVFGEIIRARLGSAETIVQTLTAGDVGSGGALLKQQFARSRPFKSVIVLDHDGLLPGGAKTLQPTPGQFVALEAGEVVIKPVTLEGQLTSVFLVRLVSAAGSPRLAYFEVAPDWIWRRPPETAADMRVAIVDADGKLLQSIGAVSAEASRIFAEYITLSGERQGTLRTLTWQDGGQQWRGVLKQVQLVNERVTAVPWAVVSFTEEQSYLSRTHGVWALLGYTSLSILLFAALGGFWVARRYLPTLGQLQSGLTAMQARRFEPLTLTAADETRELVEAFNRCGASLFEQFHALETLGEIDKLLLGSAELEQVLDAILSRVQAVTRCHCVGITLRDADAPGRGRVYLAGSGLADLPVRRVELDDDMLATLAVELRGLTIARCEDNRHSFLKPLKEVGAEFFWVWPVIVSDRIEAILSVGYREAPAADPHVARCGTQFAERLAVALSKTARDEQLYRQAHYDPLTSLPNRILFRDRLAQELTNATAGLSRGALLYIDLDHFKRVNDSVGHSAGDQLLTIVGQRLRSCVKDGDTVARLGGDEFTVILRNVTDPDAARAVGERIIQSLQVPVNIGGRDHFVCASIGITLFPDDGSTIDDLMRNADTAMYRAKDAGRGCTMFFDPHMTEATTLPSETGLQRALRRREFSLFYQPQFALPGGALAGVEALLRWQTARDGMRQPGEFVPAAEESGLIIDIGGWVLDAACAQLASWREQNIAPPRVALNVSAQQLKHIEFPKLVKRALDKYGIPPALLELELTESVFADDAAGAALGRLAQLGVHLSLDDFGTGYSSLSYLRQYPIGTVKIDRTFLDEVPENPASATLVETIIVMAHALGKRVVAEGIETPAQLEFLRERRCDIAQGFYLARPLSGQAMTELLQARTLPTNLATNLATNLESSDVRAAG
jgi:diguanylate cyclase (GGDEF)-like protein